MRIRRAWCGLCPINRWWVALLLSTLFATAARGEVHPDTAEALTLLRDGPMEAVGDTLEQEALDDPHALLTLASLDIYRGQVTWKHGGAPVAMAIFRHAEELLVAAIVQSEVLPDGHSRRLVRGQAAYLLGDLYRNVFNDQPTAQAFYESALRHLPTHPLAADKIQRILGASDAAP